MYNLYKKVFFPFPFFFSPPQEYGGEKKKGTSITRRRTALSKAFLSSFLNRKVMVLEFVGYLGGFLIAIALAPQLVKTWKTKSAKDLSLLWTTTSLIGLVLYGIYAGINKVFPLLTFATIESIMVIILIIFKLHYDRKK